jgi:hypothetical protein
MALLDRFTLDKLTADADEKGRAGWRVSDRLRGAALVNNVVRNPPLDVLLNTAGLLPRGLDAFVVCGMDDKGVMGRLMGSTDLDPLRC